MNTIITIGRQYGSGGREVGQKLAAHYGIKFYDNELLAKVAKESGFCPEIVQQQDERPTSSFLYNLVMDTYSFGYSNSAFSDMPISQKVFLAQYDTIKKIAKEEGACVIIGRCADCALQDFPNVINLFMHADEEFRIARARNYPDQRLYPAQGQAETELLQLLFHEEMGQSRHLRHVHRHKSSGHRRHGQAPHTGH